MTGIVEPDVLDLLLAQHTEIEELFAEVLTAPGERKRAGFQKLVGLLAGHEAAEGELVHPRVRAEVDAAEPVVRRRLAEEQALTRKLARLCDLGVDDPDFDRELTTLARDVLTHAALEEREEFPYLRAVLPPGELRRLAGEVRRLLDRVRAPGRKDPSTPGRKD
jgi:hemerythrin superfamily protein